MIKNTFVGLVILMVLLNCCTDNGANTPLNESEMLDIVLSNHLIHLQSEAEIRLLKKNKVKNVTFVKENISTNISDSITFLQYSEEGRIKNRTTTECTTIGCLPYIIRQEYIYDDDKVKQMRDFTFRFKYKTVLDYWMLSDTNKLSIFDWEDYTYNLDTIRIESATQIWKYRKDVNGKVVSRQHTYKMNKQQSNSIYKYSDSGIIRHLSDNNSDDNKFEYTYEVKKDNRVIEDCKINSDNFYTREYIFDHDGLLVEILYYDKQTLAAKTRRIYTFYD